MPSKPQILILLSVLFVQALAFAPSTTNTPSFARSKLVTQKCNILDVFGSMMKNFGKKASASHILIGPAQWQSQEQAQEELVALKANIGNDPVKFAEAAAKISSCPSGKKGGSLGEFGPGQMVRDFDKVVFNEDVGVVHGPISTQFGEHLILITDRTGDE
jgi:peptidyl-prolyl cis-trans isomerase C